jgi:hypothetical protein
MSPIDVRMECPLWSVINPRRGGRSPHGPSLRIVDSPGRHARDANAGARVPRRQRCTPSLARSPPARHIRALPLDANPQPHQPNGMLPVIIRSSSSAKARFAPGAAIAALLALASSAAAAQPELTERAILIGAHVSSEGASTIEGPIDFFRGTDPQPTYLESAGAGIRPGHDRRLPNRKGVPALARLRRDIARGRARAGAHRSDAAPDGGTRAPEPAPQICGLRPLRENRLGAGTVGTNVTRVREAPGA